jgi:hypothetical protein
MYVCMHACFNVLNYLIFVSLCGIVTVRYSVLRVTVLFDS